MRAQRIHIENGKVDFFFILFCSLLLLLDRLNFIYEAKHELYNGLRRPVNTATATHIRVSIVCMEHIFPWYGRF